MNEYKVFFQIYGRKMVRTVFADSHEKAEQQVINELQIDKVTLIGSVAKEDVLGDLKNIFGMN